MRKFFRRLKIISRILILLVAAAVLVLYKPELVERYLHVNPTEIVEKYLHGNPRDALQEFLGRRSAAAPASATASPSVLELYPSGSIPTTPASIPAYTGELVTVLSGNVPGFGLEGLSYRGSYAHYSELDALGRAGPAMACLGREDLPSLDRGELSPELKPSGWHNARYDELIEDHFLFNRCHILGYQLSGDSGDIHNLFTGTDYLNKQGMLPYENQVAQYLRQSKNHVLYRVTPLYVGDELVPRGVQMEAWSLEDRGRGLCFHVFVHNVQPGVIIDYATGKSRAA